MSKYLDFVETGTSPSGKTKIWCVQSKLGHIISIVKWYAPWRKYTAAFEPETIFDAMCLREIADFVAAKTAEHKIEPQS